MDQNVPASSPQIPPIPQNPPIPQPSVPSTPPQPASTQPPTPSFFHKYYFVILGVLILVVIGIPLLVYPKVLQNSRQLPLPTPTPIPFTIQNANATIAIADQQIQSTITSTQTQLATVTQASDASKLSAIINTLSQENTSLKTISSQLTNLIDASSNFANLRIPFINFNNDVTTIQTTLTADTSLVQLLTPTNKNAPKTLDTIKADLANIFNSFTDIRQNLGVIKTQLNKAPPPSPTPCVQRPSCLDAHPACKIAEPSIGWCTLTPTTTANATPSAK